MKKKNNLWNTIKNVISNVTAVVSIIMIICIIVFVIIILNYKISINIEENFIVSTTDNIPVQLPISFSLGKMSFKGDADVTIPKDTEFSMRLKMKVFLDLKKIMNAKQFVFISIK
jgi:hypothetical protein